MLSGVAAWRALVGGQLRSQVSYRTSFALNVATSLLNGVVEFIEVYVLLHNAPILGGMNFAEAALVFALATVGFSFGDLIFGQLDGIPGLIRTGQLDTYLVRPMPLLSQLITSTMQLRRLGRAGVGVVILVFSLESLRLAYSPAQVYLLIVTPLVGTAIYGSWFVVAGGLQFWLVDGFEFTNAFVYGGNYASQVPGAVLVAPLRVFFTFVVPALACAYLPALAILGMPGPATAPAWLGWWGPAFAVVAWGVALGIWRVGVRRYTGAGG